MKSSVFIIGAGFMGLTLARFFQDHNIKTFLYDRDLTKLDQLNNNNELKKVIFVRDLSEVTDVDFVIEAIPEKLDLKQRLFLHIEKLFTHSVLCTNTSSFLISEIGKKMNDKSRLIGTHFFSPADITPLVEVIPSKDTDERCISTTMNFLKAVHKKPILLRKEIPGFVANRLQTALAREAISLVEKGIVTAEDLDFIAKWSIGVRLANTGPLEQRDINGIDTHYEIAKYVYPTLENETSPLELHKRLVSNGYYGIKTLKGFYSWGKNEVNSHLKKKEETLKDIVSLLNDNDN